MKNTTTFETIYAAQNRANFTGSADQNGTSLAALILLFCAIFCVSGCVGVTGAPKTVSSQQTTSGAAAISVAPSAITFGSVALGSTASQSVTVSNTGTSSITITQASTTAAGVTVSGVSFPMTIAPGNRATLDVVFTPKSAGALSGGIAIMSSVSTMPDMVTVSGTGMAASALLTTSASSLNFGAVAIGKNSVLGVTLTNAGNSNVTISKVAASGTGYTASGVAAGLILAPGQSVTLDETFVPATAGTFSGTVSITSNATNSPANISLSGSGSASVAHAVDLTWAPSTSNVAGYDVLRSDVSGGPYAKLDSSVVTATSFSDTSVQAGKTYYYVVAAVSAAGVASADSIQASATVPTP
jgi:hypothetical protein